jgi:hypothetical protein
MQTKAQSIQEESWSNIQFPIHKFQGKSKSSIVVFSNLRRIDGLMGKTGLKQLHPQDCFLDFFAKMAVTMNEIL